MVSSDVLDELYAVAPEDFVATRTALARTARDGGDRDAAARIGELRKPTVAAWAINVVSRERPVEVDRLLDVGSRMREAQSRLDVDALRDLRRDRDAVLESFTRAARFVADASGHTLSLTAATAIRSTAVAAIADEHAAEAVRSGTLVRTLEYAGFGEVDLADAVAGDAARLPSRRASEGDDEPAAVSEVGEARRRRIERLTQELADADQELARASLVEAEAVRLSEKAAARVTELDRLLTRARSEANLRASEARDAAAAREAAARTHDEARRRLEGAQ